MFLIVSHRESEYYVPALCKEEEARKVDKSVSLVPEASRFHV